MFKFFSKTTTEKIANSDNGAYLYILFPITVVFLLTLTATRLVSNFFPNFFFTLWTESHIHHYSYGIIILVIAGYLALSNNSPRSRYVISMFYGLGLGFVFDEFGMWFHLQDDLVTRLSYDGVIVLIALFILMISAESGVHIWKRHFGKKTDGIGPILSQKDDHIDPPATP